MANEELDPEDYLAVGGPIVFHSDPFSKTAPRYTSIVRGWRKLSYILLDRPKLAGRVAALRENHPCVIRFVRNGVACAFDSLVLDWDNRQYNAYCRIEWPKSIRAVTFRRFERAHIEIPCKLFFAGTQDRGHIDDLSIGGCRISTEAPVPVNTSLELSFTLPDGCEVDRVQCSARNVQLAGDKYLVGCEFIPGQVCIESNVAFFITTMLERSGARSTAGGDILIIDEDQRLATEIRKYLIERGHDALIAAETLDGLSRVRTATPAALLISCGQKDLPAAQILQLVKRTRGLETLPVFLFSNTDPAADAHAKQLGAVAVFRTDMAPNQIAGAIASYLTATAKSHAREER